MDDETDKNKEIRKALPTIGEWQGIARRINEGETVSAEDMQRYFAGKRILAETVENVKVRLAQLTDQLRPVVQLASQIFRELSNWQSIFAKRFAPVIGALVIALKELPPRIQAALISLAQNGWYLDPSIALPELWLIEEVLLKGDSDKVDEILTIHFESQLDEIETLLIKALPARARILRAAFGAHRRGEFELSVPVFLAQSDGVCLDLTGYHFFMRDRATQKPKSSVYVAAQIGNEIASAILSPLTCVLPINATARERAKILEDKGLTDWRELNRHIVLHGEALDYGTQVNSLKAISLINYFVGVLSAPS
jgi:hypothetical protein